MKSSYVDSLSRLEEIARRNAEKRVVEAFQVLLYFNCSLVLLLFALPLISGENNAMRSFRAPSLTALLFRIY